MSQGNTVCVWVLASGPAEQIELALKWAPEPDVIVAADGGTVLAERLGLRPDLIVGDTDSSPSPLVARFAAEGAVVRTADHSTKWETDTELAVVAALEWSPNTIVLLGVLGGRLDHSLANVMLLTHPALLGKDVRLLDGPHEAYIAHAGQTTPVRGQVGDTVSLVPLGGDVEGVSTSGLRWPLRGETLRQGHGRSISNTLEEQPAAVQVAAGQLLVVVEHLA